jgi:hypothetical protein
MPQIPDDYRLKRALTQVMRRLGVINNYPEPETEELLLKVEHWIKIDDERWRSSWMHRSIPELDNDIPF